MDVPKLVPKDQLSTCSANLRDKLTTKFVPEQFLIFASDTKIRPRDGYVGVGAYLLLIKYVVCEKTLKFIYKKLTSYVKMN